MSFTIHITWKGRTTAICLPVTNPSIEELGLCIEKELGASYETIKLLVPGRKGHLAPARERGHSASIAGLANGCKALLLASNAEDITRVRASRDLSGMRGFEDELKRAARRRRTNCTDANPHPPRADYTFGTYEVWQRAGLHPPPAEALKLLYRLANDPGILGVMETHRYRVGLLSEMPPEGKVGVSPMCILGVNINAGQEISLRLRTDDLKGFRKYERIRETLLHELAHMEVAEHDNNFKQLNSQLGRECAAINSRFVGGRSLLTNEDERLLSLAAQVDRRSELDDPSFVLEGADAVMAATARFSGKTLRQLAAISDNGSPPLALSGVPAGGKAVTTGTAVVASTMANSRDNINEAALPGGDELVGVKQSATSRGVVEDSENAGGSSDDIDIGDAERQYEHFDAATERSELAARQLGSMEDQRGEQLSCRSQAFMSVGQATDIDAGDSGAGKVGSGIEAEAMKPLHLAASMKTVMATPIGRWPSKSSSSAELGAMSTPLPSVVGVKQEAGDCMDADSATRDASKAATSGSALESLPKPTSELPGMLVCGRDTGTAPVESEVVADFGETISSGVVDLVSLGHCVPKRDGSNEASPHGGLTEHLVEQCDKAPAPVQLTLQPPIELLEDDAEGGGRGAFVTNADYGLAAAQAKLRQAWNALALMASATHGSGQVVLDSAMVSPHSSAAGEDVVTALNTIETVLGNAVNFPMEDRYRRVRLGNTTFQRRVGRLPGGIELLRIAGFTEEAAGPDAVLRLRRNDPGLLWLVLSAVREAKEQVTAQLAGSTAVAIISRLEGNTLRQA